MYCITLVQSLYISCYVSLNKLVQSYLLLHLLLQRWFRSVCTLCTVHYLCTFKHRQLPAQVDLSFAFISDFFHSNLQCTQHWLQLSNCFLLIFHLEDYNFLFFLLEVGCSYHTQFWTRSFSVAHIFVCAVVCLLYTVSAAAHIFVSGSTPNPVLVFLSCFFIPLTLFPLFCFVHVISWPTEHFSVKTLFLPFFVCTSFCRTVATRFYSSWDECPTNLWRLPLFP